MIPSVQPYEAEVIVNIIAESVLDAVTIKESVRTVQNTKGSASKFQYNEIYDEEYAGMFYDDKGVLNICITSNSAEKYYEIAETVTKSTNSIVKAKEAISTVNKVRSYNYLNRIRNLLLLQMEELSIVGIGINEKENRIDVTVTQDQETDILDYLSGEIDNFDEASVFVDKGDVFAPTADYGYSGRGIGTEWYGGNLGTIGFNARDKSTNKYGIVTNHHVAPKGRKMHYDDNEIGISSKSAIGNTTDCSFIPFKETIYIFGIPVGTDWKPTANMKVHGSEDRNYKIAGTRSTTQGFNTNKYGRATGYDAGKILYSSYSAAFYNSDGDYYYEISDGFLCSNYSEGGDSGGPIGDVPAKSTSFYLMGITVGSNGVNTFGCKQQNIVADLNIEIVFSYTSL